MAKIKSRLQTEQVAKAIVVCGSLSLGSNPSSRMMPCSTTVVQDAVNIEVIGSNPIGAVYWRSSTVERRSPKP